MGRIIVIDGTSNAGKTTLCENIERNIKNVVIVPGASLFVKMHKEKYPSIPAIPKDIQEEKENQKFFFGLELDRLIEANRLAKQDVDVFMDRGVLEVLSVAYSFESIKQWNGIYENAEKLYKRFIKIVNDKEIQLPDTHILLQASVEEVKRRNMLRQIERGQKLSENNWVEDELINKQIEFFDELNILENRNKIKLIDTNNKNKKEVLENVCEILNLKEREEDREK